MNSSDLYRVKLRCEMWSHPPQQIFSTNATYSKLYESEVVVVLFFEIIKDPLDGREIAAAYVLSQKGIGWIDWSEQFIEPV